MINNKTEALATNQITRLEADIAERETDNPFHTQLNEVDLKNIASLREARIPQYSDHMFTLGSDSMDMFEFADLTEAMTGVNPWPRDPAIS